MKILFVLEHYHPHTGGVEILFKNLCEGLVKKGHEIEVITARLKNTKKKEIINGVKITRINVLPFLRRYSFTFLAIPYVVKAGKNYDVIHTTTYNGAFPAKISALLNKKPSIITVHEVLGKKWKIWANTGFIASKILDVLEKMIVKLNFDKYISVSKSTKKQLKEYKIKDNKLDVIYNGVDYELFDSKKYNKESREIREFKYKNKKEVYLFYGRPGNSKGFEYLLKAVPKISREFPNSLFVAILGKRPEKKYEQFVKEINDHPYKNNILLIEPVKYSELPKYVKAADIIIVPSLTEGFGYCVAESCAMNKIVVASNTTSIPEVISGKHILIEPKKPRNIANAVISAFKGDFNKTKLKKFQWDSFVDKYESIYKELIN